MVRAWVVGHGSWVMGHGSVSVSVSVSVFTSKYGEVREHTEWAGGSEFFTHSVLVVINYCLGLFLNEIKV
jgi:hypothetical protein